MKVRIGISLGPAGTPDQFAGAVDLLEQAGVDSLWLPENVYSPLVEPFTGMAFALARTRRLKAGTGISVLPGRHPVLVAKQLASLAGLAPGRVLPVFGLLPAQDAERALFTVPDGQRAAVFDESLELLRLLLTTEKVDFAGQFFSVSGATVRTRPAKPLDLWLGGSAPAGLRRVGRLADGWLGSLLTPAEAGAAVTIIQDAAAAAGREVEDDHFGLSLPVTLAGNEHGIPAPLLASINRRRPEADPATLVAAELGRCPPDARAVRRGRAEQVRGAAGEPGTVRPVPRRLRPRAPPHPELVPAPTPVTAAPARRAAGPRRCDSAVVRTSTMWHRRGSLRSRRCSPRLARDAVVQHQERQAEHPERVLGPQFAPLDIDVEPLGEPAHGDRGQLGRLRVYISKVVARLVELAVAVQHQALPIPGPIPGPFRAHSRRPAGTAAAAWR